MTRSGSTKALWLAKSGYILISALLCILGIVLIIQPELSVSVVSRAFGILLIISGIVKLIGYFSGDPYQLAFQYDLAFGILLLALGIVLLVRKNITMNFISLMMGISILADALFKVQTAVDARRFGLSQWWLTLLFAILTGTIGIILIFRTSVQDLLPWQGTALLAEGILNLHMAITAVKIIHTQLPEQFENRKEC